jgi:hypothetical protein
MAERTAATITTSSSFLAKRAAFDELAIVVVVVVVVVVGERPGTRHSLGLYAKDIYHMIPFHFLLITEPFHGTGTPPSQGNHPGSSTHRTASFIRQRVTESSTP